MTKVGVPPEAQVTVRGPASCAVASTADSTVRSMAGPRILIILLDLTWLLDLTACHAGRCELLHPLLRTVCCPGWPMLAAGAV